MQGTLSGQFSPSTYKKILEALLRRDFTTGASMTGVTNANAAYDATNGILTVTSTPTNFISAGFKIGDVLRITGLTGGAAVDNGDNLRVLAISANAMSLLCPSGATAAAWSTGQTEAFSVAGKKTYVPATGQTDKSFTIEQWFSDVGVSEVYTGCKVTQVLLNIPASGFVTFQASFTGQNATIGASQFHSAAAAPTSTTSLTSTGGRLIYGSSPIAVVTGMNLQIQAQADQPPVAGSNVAPYVFLGTLMARGSFTSLFTQDGLTADFFAENDVRLGMLLTTSPADNAEFVSINMPKVRLTSATKNDSDRAITRSFSFMALEQAAGGTGTGDDLTTISVQDSLA